MIITPKQPRNDKTRSRLSSLVPYMLRGQSKERCTWYTAGNLAGLDRREDAGLAVDVMELLQEGNQRAKGSKTYHLVISFHPGDRRLTPAELEEVVRRAVRAAGLEEHQYIAVRHSEQEHEHLHVAVNKIHPQTLKIHHPYKAIHGYQALSSALEEELGLHRVDRTRSHCQSHRAREFEAHRGLESFSRWASRSIGVTELNRIESWPALHEELKRFGVRLVPRGNGLAIVDTTRANLRCKASSLGRQWSKRRLCERYGEFVPGASAVEVAREQVNAYVERPLGRALDDGLWHEYQEALAAARIHRSELREALTRRVDAARAAHRRRFKLTHHAIAAMPIPGQDKRSLYKNLSLERRMAERGLRATIKQWRTLRLDAHPGSWKEFLAARAGHGDQRAIGRLIRPFRGPTIKSGDKRLRFLPSRGLQTSRGSVVHNLGGGIRLRESARSIELLGDARDEALEQLVGVAKQKLGTKGLTLLGPRRVQERLSKMAAEQGLEIGEERQR
jgi:hypothetical protein